LATWEAATKFGWTVLPHPPCSLDLAPSDIHLFGALKDAVCGTKFEIDGDGDDDDVFHTMRTWLREQDKAWYRQSMHTLVPHWHKAVAMNGEYVEV
jgi:histone-lysine N-methyltransferase SETMAR